MTAKRLKHDESWFAPRFEAHRRKQLADLRRITSRPWYTVAGPDGLERFMTCDRRYYYCSICGGSLSKGVAQKHDDDCLIAMEFPELRRNDRKGE